MKKFISWEEVVKHHKTINGVSSKSGLVNSLLCNSATNRVYPNVIKEDKITYFVNDKTPAQGVNALFRSLEQKNYFSVYEKLSVNQWKNLGKFSVESYRKEKNGYISFELIKEAEPSGAFEQKPTVLS